MNILIITEVFLIGGLETNLAGEISELVNQGHSVYLAVGEHFDISLVPSEVTGILSGLNLSHDVGPVEFVQAINSLRQYVSANDIDILHAQPFYSIIAAAIVAELEHRPLVLTLHGPASFANHLSPVFRFLLNGIILPGANITFTVSQEVKDLCSTFSSAGNFYVLPNGVDTKLTQYVSTEVAEDERWICVSRLDDEKSVGVLHFIKTAYAIGLPGVVVVGDGNARQFLEEEVNKLILPDGFVEFIGASLDVCALLPSFAGVAGMGRVVLEGIAAKKKVILVGYDGVKAVIDPHTFKKAALCNFSGRNFNNIEENGLKDSLSTISDDNIELCHDIVQRDYSINNIWLYFSKLCLNVLEQPFSSRGNFLRKFFNIINSGNIFFSGSDNIYFSKISQDIIGRIVAGAPETVGIKNYYALLLKEKDYLNEQDRINRVKLEMNDFKQSFDNKINQLVKAENFERLFAEFEKMRKEIAILHNEINVLNSRIEDANTKHGVLEWLSKRSK